MKYFFEKEAGVVVGDIYSPHLLAGRVFVGLASLFYLRTFVIFWVEILKMPWTIYRQVQTFKTENVDIIHLNSSILFIVAISAKILKIKLVWHIREVIIGGRWSLKKRFAGWYIRTLADQVICISEVEAKSLGNDTKKNVHIVYNFIDFSNFVCNKTDMQEEKLRYGVNSEKVFISLGGVSFRKGTVEIIQTAKILPESLFFIAGSYPVNHDYTRYKKILLRFIHSLEDILMKNNIKQIYSWYYTQRVEMLYFGLKLPNLKFVGQLNSVNSFLAISHALIFSGCTPHFPRPVYESWAMKKPVVVFDIDGVRGNIDSGVDGVVCKSNDASGLAEALLLVHSGMGESGYKKAVVKFDMVTNVKKIVEIYEAI
jgi:glycosyltransferase involved in cell wall biosynthesis